MIFILLGIIIGIAVLEIMLLVWKHFREKYIYEKNTPAYKSSHYYVCQKCGKETECLIRSDYGVNFGSGYCSDCTDETIQNIIDDNNHSLNATIIKEFLRRKSLLMYGENIFENATFVSMTDKLRSEIKGMSNEDAEKYIREKDEFEKSLPQGD